MSNANTSQPVTVSIFGSTGSIGRQALEVVRSSNERLAVHALSVHSNLDALCEQIREFLPKVVVVRDHEMAQAVIDRFPGVSVRVGGDGLYETAHEADVALNAVVGFAGLSVTLGAIDGGRRLALANKESLVAAGPIVKAALSRSASEIVPVDSEHAAIHQCMRSGNRNEVARVILTSSGGPFRTRDQASLSLVTKSDALQHPTWAMGPKITVDSSTLMNKALEIIEAVELFDLAPSEVEVVVHPESIVHSLVAFVDGSIMAQLSSPDMRLPIAYALWYPQRNSPEFGKMDFSRALSLNFEPPRRDVFKGIDFAYEALRLGSGAPAWLNAVNEVAVAHFLTEEIRWVDLYPVIEAAMEKFEPVSLVSAADVVELDQIARLRCLEVIEKHFAGIG